MRRIRLHLPGRSGEAFFDPTARDNATEPFIVLREKLRSLGFELESSNDEDLSGVYALWFWDVIGAVGAPGRLRRSAARLIGGGSGGGVTPSSLLSRALRSSLRDRLVLFLGEPPAVLAQNWDTRWHRWFTRVFTWHDPLVDGGRYVKYFFPVPLDFPPVPDVPFRERKLLANISGNKSSCHAGELYSARVKSIRFFEGAASADFDLFGVGWERGDADGVAYSSYRGSVANKWDVLPWYRFCLCYENQQMEGYVTEKIFDCLRCGVVPVYLGAPEIDRVVDPACFIDRREFPSDAALLRFLRETSEESFCTYREAMKAYLASPTFARFTSPAFAETVVRALGLADSADALAIISSVGTPPQDPSASDPNVEEARAASWRSEHGVS